MVTPAGKGARAEQSVVTLPIRDGCCKRHSEQVGLRGGLAWNSKQAMLIFVHYDCCDDTSVAAKCCHVQRAWVQSALHDQQLGRNGPIPAFIVADFGGISMDTYK